MGRRVRVLGVSPEILSTDGQLHAWAATRRTPPYRGRVLARDRPRRGAPRRVRPLGRETSTAAARGVPGASHDPTQVDRQGPDVGDQYRARSSPTSDEQQRAAEASRDAAQARFDRPIATEITPAGPFYPAEDYHQRYYDKNGHEPYCHVIPWATLRELGLVKAGA